MISFSTGKVRKKMSWANKKFLFFSTTKTGKDLWEKLVKTSDKFVIKY